MFKLTTTLADIAKTSPSIQAKLREYRLDFCCGGHDTLKQACLELNLDATEVLNNLNTLPSTQHENWETAPMGDLVNHILDTHHAYLYQALPELSQLTTTLLRVHGANHESLKKLHSSFHSLKTELEQHLIKEETVQYPALYDYLKNPTQSSLQTAQSVIGELEEEHEAAGALLKTMRQVTKDYTLPRDACETYHYTFNQLEALEADMFTHIHLENNILFTRLLQLNHKDS